MIDTSLVKALLDHDCYLQSKDRLRASLFSEDVRDVFEVLSEAHQKYQHDLTVEDLSALWRAANPVATGAQKNDFRELLEDIDDAKPMSAAVAADAITELWKRDLGTRVAELGLKISEGDDAVLADLKALVATSDKGFVDEGLTEFTSQNLEDLWDLFGDDHRFKFNIPTLSKKVYGIGPEEFGIVFATPETGKTAFIVSICCGPEGFTDQGKKVLVLGNEEATRRTVVRAYECVTGRNGEQIRDDPEAAVAIYKGKTRDKLYFKDIQEWTMTKVDALLGVLKPDVVIIDQLDKVVLEARYEAGHERLRELYRQAREMAKRHHCALIGVSQASNDANGRTRLDYSMMEGSKIGKAAEADLIIGIGKDSDDDRNMRYLNVSKNKLSGWHGQIICQIQPEISRYVA